MQDADHVVTFALDHRKARVGGGNHLRHELLEALRDVDDIHLGARHHDVAHRKFRDLQNAFDHGKRISIEQLALMRGAQQRKKLFSVFGGAQ